MAGRMAAVVAIVVEPRVVLIAGYQKLRIYAVSKVHTHPTYKRTVASILPLNPLHHRYQSHRSSEQPQDCIPHVGRISRVSSQRPAEICLH